LHFGIAIGNFKTWAPLLKIVWLQFIHINEQRLNFLWVLTGAMEPNIYPLATM
jgi:hypothetical protein